MKKHIVVFDITNIVDWSYEHGSNMVLDSFRPGTKEKVDFYVHESLAHPIL